MALTLVMSDEQTDGLTTAEAVQYARDLRAYAAVVRNPLAGGRACVERHLDERHAVVFVLAEAVLEPVGAVWSLPVCVYVWPNNSLPQTSTTLKV